MGLKEQQTESTFESWGVFFFVYKQVLQTFSQTNQKEKRIHINKIRKKALEISNLSEIQRISNENSVNLCYEKDINKLLLVTYNK